MSHAEFIADPDSGLPKQFLKDYAKFLSSYKKWKDRKNKERDRRLQDMGLKKAPRPTWPYEMLAVTWDQGPATMMPPAEACGVVGLTDGSLRVLMYRGKGTLTRRIGDAMVTIKRTGQYYAKQDINP